MVRKDRPIPSPYLSQPPKKEKKKKERQTRILGYFYPQLTGSHSPVCFVTLVLSIKSFGKEKKKEERKKKKN